jgi:two-component system capsular synthesis response regulator RcsB
MAVKPAVRARLAHARGNVHMTTIPIRVAVADDHPAVVIGIAHELAAADNIQLIGTAADSSELVALLEANRCDVAITDYAMPGGAYGDGAALLSYIRRRYPRVHIVVFTMMENPGLVLNIFELGIGCVVSKADPTHHLVEAARAAAAGRRYLSPTIEAALADAPLHGPRALTQRESEVVRLFVSGLTVNEIAARLNRSKKTVSAQKMSAMKKLGIERETDLYQYAMTSGLVPAEQAPGL